MGFPSSQRSIQSCPAGQLHNSKEVGRTKTKDLSSYFLERGGCAERSEGADGVARSASPIGQSLNRSSAKSLGCRSDHPGCAASVASRHFLAQPPLLCEEGNVALLEVLDVLLVFRAKVFVQV